MNMERKGAGQEIQSGYFSSFWVVLDFSEQSALPRRAVRFGESLRLSRRGTGEVAHAERRQWGDAGLQGAAVPASPILAAEAVQGTARAAGG